jgi:hypothetical protein
VLNHQLSRVAFSQSRVSHTKSKEIRETKGLICCACVRAQSERFPNVASILKPYWYLKSPTRLYPVFKRSSYSASPSRCVVFFREAAFAENRGYFDHREGRKLWRRLRMMFPLILGRILILWADSDGWRLYTFSHPFVRVGWFVQTACTVSDRVISCHWRNFQATSAS